MRWSVPDYTQAGYEMQVPPQSVTAHLLLVNGRSRVRAATLPAIGSKQRSAASYAWLAHR
jgi:hypothetical protein